jgi:uncharacterized membrane protein
MQSTNTDFTQDLGEAIGYLEAFAERKIQIAKLDAAEKLAKTTASLATGFVLLALVPVFLCVFSVALGFLMVETYGFSFANSFFLLSGIYFLLGIVLFIARQQLFTNPILGMVISDIFKK